METLNKVLQGDCRKVLGKIPDESISACITDPPYNYEFIGHKWNVSEIRRRLERIQDSNTLVKNIPYGSGLAGGVRNARWYARVRKNNLDYEEWCFQWACEVLRVCKPGAFVAAFNSNRTAAHLQVALERAGFYARDCLVYRRSTGIPKGLNASAQMKKRGMRGAEQWEGWNSCLRNEWEAVVVVQKPLSRNYFETITKYGVGLFNAAPNGGSFRSNIIEGISREPNEGWNLHCTVKPVALMERLIDLFVPHPSKHVLLDPFAGSGSTLVAARNLGVQYVGIEIEPEYIEIINKRLSSSPKFVKKRVISGQSQSFQLFPLETS